MHRGCFVINTLGRTLSLLFQCPFAESNTFKPHRGHSGQINVTSAYAWSVCLRIFFSGSVAKSGRAVTPLRKYKNEIIHLHRGRLSLKVTSVFPLGKLSVFRARLKLPKIYIVYLHLSREGCSYSEQQLYSRAVESYVSICTWGKSVVFRASS